jgi:hypothetical protein
MQLPPNCTTKLIAQFNPPAVICDQARTAECREAGSEEQLLKKIRQAYNGKVVVGHDLDIYRFESGRFESGAIRILGWQFAETAGRAETLHGSLLCAAFAMRVAGSSFRCD